MNYMFIIIILFMLAPDQTGCSECLCLQIHQRRNEDVHTGVNAGVCGYFGSLVHLDTIHVKTSVSEPEPVLQEYKQFTLILVTVDNNNKQVKQGKIKKI